MSRPITSYFATMTREEFLAQAATRPPRALPATPPIKRPVGRPRKTSTKEQENLGHGTPHPQNRSVDDSEQESSSSMANKPSTKSVRCQYSYRQKERVVEYARHHGIRAAARKFNIARKNVQRWFKELKDKPSLFHTSKPSKKRRLLPRDRCKAGGKLSYPNEVDEKLLEWLLSMRERHLCVSTQMLRDKAKAAITDHNPSFQASEGWLKKFMNRHSIVLRAKTSVAQKLPRSRRKNWRILQGHTECKRKLESTPTKQ